MATTVWSVAVDGQEHKVELVHRWVTGIRRVRVDGEVVHRVREFFTTGGIFRVVSILQDRAQVWLITGATTYAYYLMLDGCPVPSERQKARGVTPERLMADRNLRDLYYWRGLADRLGLRYMAMTSAAWRFQHRLAGQLENRPVVVFIGVQGKQQRPAVYVRVRHPALPDVQANASAIVDDPKLDPIWPANTKRGSAIDFGEVFSRLMLPYEPKKQPVEELAARIRTFVEVVDAHTPALVPERCDECDFSSASKTVLLHDTLVLRLCDGCLEKYRHEGAEARRRYDALPGRLLPGALAGLAVSLLLSPVWAAVIVLLDRMGAITSMVTFAAIIKVMDRLGTKRTLVSTIAASALCVPGVFLSTWLAVAWLIFQEGYEVSPAFFQVATEVTLESKLLTAGLFYAALGILVMVITAWLEQRKALRDYFQVKVEYVTDIRRD